MANGRNRLFFRIAFIIASIPTIIGIYLYQHDMSLHSVVLFTISIVFLVTSTGLFISYKVFKHGTPLLFGFLTELSQSLAPFANYLSNTDTILAPMFSLVIRFTFYLGFIILLMSDHLIRTVLAYIVGLHPSKRYYSITSAMNPNIEMFDDTIPRTKHLENSDLFQMRKQLHMTNKGKGEPKSRELTALLKRPRYSVGLAYTLSVASRLVYEDVDVIQYELKRAGFDIEGSFKPIAYKNLCAFIVEKDNDIILVFRGTNPLNVQNYITNIRIKTLEIESSKGRMGKVHKGYWEALGEPIKRNGLSPKPTLERDPTRIKIELVNTSVYRTVMSTFLAIGKSLKFLISNLFRHVKEPIDTSWVGPDIDIRSNSMCALAEEHILHLIQKVKKPTHPRALRKKRLFITGHSLGGALSTIFLAKMLQSDSPLLDYFEGLYTFGQPKIGDQDFAKVFSPQMSSKIFHHVYNNDIIPRIFHNYHSPPGSMVYIDSAYNITIYPPNPYTNEPVPVRPISFLHLSGLLNLNVIRRLPRENHVRILLRILFPFFINDHFPCDYTESLRQGHVQWVIMGEGGLEGGYNTIDTQKKNTQRRYSMVDVQD